MKKIIDELHTELFEALEIALAICDMDGNTVYVNQAFANLTGHSKEEIYKLTYWDITPKKYEKEEQVQLESLSKTKSYGPYEKEYVHKNGSLIPVLLNGKIVNISGVDYIWSSVEDISFSKTIETKTDLESKSRLIEDSQNEIFIFDFHSLKFLYVNEAARSNIGYSEEELLAMEPVNIKPNISSEVFNDMIKPLISREKDKLNFETVHQRKDGTIYNVDIRLQTGFYAGNEIFVAYIWDISEKIKIEKREEKIVKELGEVLQLQKAIQDYSTYAIITTTTEGIITSFNKAAESMLGYNSEEVVGIESPAIFHDLDEVVEKSILFSKLLGTEIEPGFTTFTCLPDRNIKSEYEWNYFTKDGSKILVHLSITALRNSEGQITGYLGISNDITKRKEKEIELHNAKLAAEKALSIKSDFLANMSHEIRTPMNGILGMTSLLLDETIKRESLDKIANIQYCSESLLKIINDILDISKIDEKRIEIEEVDFNLKDLLKNIFELHKVSSSSKSIEFTYSISKDVPDFVKSDELRIKQIIDNILNNAVKFTQEGKINLDISLDKKIIDQKKLINITISDSGIGINSSDHEKIFNSFSQADSSTTRRFGGTGLGLHISKKYVELMNGEISVTSELGKGATFEIKIPVIEITLKDNQNKEQEVEFEHFALDILIVEDVVMNQKVIKGHLSKFGYEPDIVSNGQEALDRLESNSYDLIFMDCHMPILDGFEATKEIIKKYKNERPYVVALTASAMEEDINRCYAAGMDEFLSKPISKKTLKNFFSNYKSKIS
jgi:PAS domain S-box-containing protein